MRTPLSAGDKIFMGLLEKLIDFLEIPYTAFKKMSELF